MYVTKLTLHKPKDLQELESQIADLKYKLNELNEQRDLVIGDTRYTCPNCYNSPRIASSVITQTHGYIPPRGCSGGDYWVPSLVEIQCPQCDTSLRCSSELTEEMKKLIKHFGKTLDDYR